MQHLTRAQASEFLTSQGYPVARSTLQKYATVGGGPLYQRFGNRVLYTEANLLDWVKNKLSTPIVSTSEESARSMHGEQR